MVTFKLGCFQKTVRFSVAVDNNVRGSFDVREDAERLAWEIACDEMTDVEVRPVESWEKAYGHL